MKFQYSPGQIGYGTQGTDGSLGLTGNAIYFIDRNPDSDIRMKTLIENNEVFWTDAEVGTKLPNGRAYSSGDIIIDYQGFVYEIDLSLTEKGYFNTSAELKKPGFFVKSAAKTDNDYYRMYNKVDPSVRYLIDNFLSSNSNLDYSKFPSAIYGIPANNFARIEHGDIVENNYMPFSLYSSGVSQPADDDKSLGIVRAINTNEFKIGNINNSNLRNTNLIFDVSSLKYKRETGNLFNKNTASGTILTNSEININQLFYPEFNDNPASFKVVTHGAYLDMYWNLRDFTTDTSIKGTIVFSKKASTGNAAWDIDASILRPLVFYNVGNSGSFIISKLIANDTYQYYMIIEKDGWERTSMVQTRVCTGEPTNLIITDPFSKILSSDYLGVFSPDNTPWKTVYLNTNSVTNWYVTLVDNCNWINIARGSGPAGIGQSFDVTLLPNIDVKVRIGTIRVNSEALYQDIIVNQDYYQSQIYFNANGYLKFTTPLTNQTISVTIDLYIHACAEGALLLPRITDQWIRVYKNGNKICDIESGRATGKGREDINKSLVTPFTFTMTKDDQVRIKFYGEHKDGGDAWTDRIEGIDFHYHSSGDSDSHRFGGGWARITSILKTAGDDGNFSIDTTNRLYYKKRDYNSSTIYDGIRYEGVQSDPPEIQHIS